jgi:hypothetical protein
LNIGLFGQKVQEKSISKCFSGMVSSPKISFREVMYLQSFSKTLKEMAFPVVISRWFEGVICDPGRKRNRRRVVRCHAPFIHSHMCLVVMAGGA